MTHSKPARALLLLSAILVASNVAATEVLSETNGAPASLQQWRSEQRSLFERLRAWIGTVPNAAAHLELTPADVRRIRDYNDHAAPAAPPRAGVVKPVDISIDFATTGPLDLRESPTPLGDGIARLTESRRLAWALRLEAANTGGVRFKIEDLRLPAGAKLYLYNQAGEVRGPYDGSPRDVWTHSIGGGSVYLQLDYPDPDPRASDRIAFHIASVLLLEPSGQSFCAPNAVCMEDGSCFDSVDWPRIDDARRGVANILYVEGAYAYICSGGLLNDTDHSSFVPYFITANHCVSSQVVAASVETRFQFSTNACGGACYWPSMPSTSGATLLHTSSDDDHSLLQLREPPPAGSVFLGWTNEPVASRSGRYLYRLSHPQGSPQAFSTHVVDATAPTCANAPRGRYIYSRNAIGATEGGSSGAPLLTETAQVVGQLHGICGLNPSNVCDSTNNRAVDGAFASYFPSLASWLAPSPSASPILLPNQAALTDHQWTTVTAASGHPNAVVLAGPPTANGSDPGVVRLRNVDASGFELRFQEWDYRDGGHLSEAVPYLVLQPGRHVMSDGSVWEVGRFELGGTGNWAGVSFSQRFPAAPFLFLTLQTTNGEQAASARALGVSDTGFQAALFEQESLMDGHVAETVGYLAVHSPSGGGLIDIGGRQVPYLLQRLVADHRWVPVLSQRLRLEEEQSRDSETSHIDETLHALSLGRHLFAQQVSHNGPDTTALRRLPPTGEAPMEWGLIRGTDHNWQTLPFAKSYVDPVVIAKPASSFGPDPGVIRLRDVKAGHAQLRYQEWDYLDEQHMPEDVFYLVSESGRHSLGGLAVEADRVQSDKLGRAGQWEAVGLQGSFSSAPVALSSVMTYNGSDAVTTRIRGLNAAGFALAMDEQESKADGHASETLGWVAIHPGGARTLEGRALDVGFTSLDHNPATLRYGILTSHRLASVIADIDSADGMDPVALRYANPTSTGIMLKLSEEQSADTETDHVTESIGAFIAE